MKKKFDRLLYTWMWNVSLQQNNTFYLKINTFRDAISSNSFKTIQLWSKFQIPTTQQRCVDHKCSTASPPSYSQPESLIRCGIYASYWSLNGSDFPSSPCSEHPLFKLTSFTKSRYEPDNTQKSWDHISKGERQNTAVGNTARDVGISVP